MNLFELAYVAVFVERKTLSEKEKKVVDDKVFR